MYFTIYLLIKNNIIIASMWHESPWILNSTWLSKFEFSCTKLHAQQHNLTWVVHWANGVPYIGVMEHYTNCAWL